VDKIELPGLLMELSKKYFDQLGRARKPEHAVKKENKPPEREVFQCPDCMTVYDPALGDEKSGIQAGVAFEDLPAGYCCTVCEAPKATFTKTALALS
jgi:rubredoxin